MNIEIVSNVKPKIKEKNYINDFELLLQESIDCQNVELHIILKNVKKIESTALAGLKYIHKKISTTTQQDKETIPVPGYLNIKLNKVKLPVGCYDVNIILDTINRNLSKFGCLTILN